MAATEPRRRFHLSRDQAFWVLTAAGLVVLGILLDMLWGGV